MLILARKNITFRDFEAQKSVIITLLEQVKEGTSTRVQSVMHYTLRRDIN